MSPPLMYLSLLLYQIVKNFLVKQNNNKLHLADCCDATQLNELQRLLTSNENVSNKLPTIFAHNETASFVQINFALHFTQALVRLELWDSNMRLRNKAFGDAYHSIFF